jgi:23S rRNA (guanosine2251-2'-O)-methyltransferase
MLFTPFPRSFINNIPTEPHLFFVAKFHLKQYLCRMTQNRKLKLWELERVDETAFKQQEKFPVIIVLNDIRSLNNIGAFFRTADAFNVEKIYLCGITATPPHRDIQRTALGATETVEWEHASSILEVVHKLKKEGTVVCSIEQAEKTVLLQDVPQLPGERFALVFGNEVNGVDQDVIDASDVILEIPQWGTKHSLNVSVCAGIVMWEFAKRFGA